MDQWENDLGAQWMPLRYKHPNGKIIDGRVKLAIREVKLHEVVFPKEYEEAVMGLINPSVGTDKQIGKWTKIIPKLVRFLGLKKPLQKWKQNNTIFNNGVATLALGTKEDIMNFDISEAIQDQGITPQENL